MIEWLGRLLLLAALLLQTGPVHVKWVVGEAPDDGWTVGDPIPLRLEATFPPDLSVVLPELPPQWGPFEVREQTLLPPTDNGDGTRTLVRQVTVTLWEPGEHPTPPLTVQYRDTAGELHQIPVPTTTLTIVSVLTEDDLEKRDLKPQASLPRPPLWPWVVGGLFLAGVTGLLAWRLLTHLRRRPAPAPAPLVADPRPPHEIAYQELDRIAALDLPARGELKRHYTLIADCIRAYVHGRYRVPALDQTTGELLAALRGHPDARQHVGLFRSLLDEADLVKFARHRPGIAQARAALDQARHIVDVTRPPTPPEHPPEDP